MIRNRLGWLAIASVFGTALILSFFNITNLDIGGHLTVGREILKTRAIPSTDFFTHTIKGAPYPVHQWLGEVALFVVDHFTGVVGLIFLRMMIVLYAATLLYRNARRAGSPGVVAAGIVLLLLVAARPRFFMRPFLVTIIFLPLLQSWLAEARQENGRGLWRIVPLMTIWGHLHSGVVFGVLLLLATLVGEGGKILFARMFRGASRVQEAGRGFRRLTAFAALAAILPFATVALVNPSGVKPLLLPFLFFQNEALRGMIAEYRPVQFSVDWPFNLVAAAVVLGIVLRPRRLDVTELLVVGGFGYLALEAVRGILPFAVVSAPLLGRTWGAAFGPLLERADRGPQGKAQLAARLLQLALIFAVLAASGFASYRCAGGWLYPFGFGKDPKHYPERALDFIYSQNIRGPIFNTDLWASSMLWRWHGRRLPVFVDARLEAYPEEFWRDKYYRVLRAAPGWKEVLEEYDVQCALLRRRSGEADDRIGDVLWADPEWGLAYWDDHVLVYLKRGNQRARNAQVLAGWEFTSFNPREAQSVVDLRDEELVRAANELSGIAEWVPNSLLPWWTLGVAWTGLGNGEEAAEIFEMLAERRGTRRRASFNRSWAGAELVAGRRERWEELLREAGADPADPSELFRGAALLTQAGKNEPARTMYRDILAADPENTDAMNNLAILLAHTDHEIPRALELIQEAIERNPRDPYYVASRGEVYWRAGDMEKAEADFQRAFEMLPAEDREARDEVTRWLDRIE